MTAVWKRLSSGLSPRLRRAGAVAGWLSVGATAFAVAGAGVGRASPTAPSARWLAIAAGTLAVLLLAWAAAWYLRGRRGRTDTWVSAGLPLLVSADAWLIAAFQYLHEPTNHLFASGLVTTELIAMPSIPEWLIVKHLLVAVLWAAWPRLRAWSFESSPTMANWRPLALQALALLAAIAYVRFAILDVLTIEVPSDLRVNYVGALAMREGLNPYDNAVALQVAGRERIPYVGTRLWAMVTNPPTAMLYFAPYTLLPLEFARLVFLAANHLALLAALALIWRLVRPRVHWTVWSGAMLGLVVLLDPILLVLRLGQVDLLIAALLAAAALRLRRGDDYWGGGFIALAAGLKLAPVLLVLYLIWRRRWRALAGALATGAAVLALSLPLAGIDTWRFYLTERLPDLLAGSALMNNLSLPGLVLRVFMGPQLAQGFLDRQPDIPLAQILIYVAIVATLAAAVWALRGPARGGRAFTLEFGLAVCIVLVVGGVTWPHYLTWLLPIVGLLAAGASPGAGARWPLLVVGLGLALAAIPIEAYDGLFGWAFDRSVLALSLRNIGLLLTLLGLLLAVRWSRPPEEGGT